MQRRWRIAIAGGVGVVASAACVHHITSTLPVARDQQPALPAPAARVATGVELGLSLSDRIEARQGSAAADAPASPLLLPAAPPLPANVVAEDDPEVTKVMAASRAYEPEPSAATQQERDTTVAALVASGSGGNQWLSDVQRIEQEWLRLDSVAGVGVELSRWQCYRNGCTVSVTLPSVSAHERFNALVQSSLVALWKGPGFRSGPVRTDTGEIEETWVFYAPQVGG